MKLDIREANLNDIQYILQIYNEGIVDRIATLETTTKDSSFMMDWFLNRNKRYKVLVAEIQSEIVGWASLNPYNSRSAYDGVADLSLYIKREFRGSGIGGRLINSIEHAALNLQFHKIILFTFPFNQLGQGVYRKKGYREVGIFKEQGVLDGDFVDVMAMEKLLKGGE